jgi:hypothetical protein
MNMGKETDGGGSQAAAPDRTEQRRSGPELNRSQNRAGGNE